jgi:membrane protease YdiL (CAAX protease family)
VVGRRRGEVRTVRTRVADASVEGARDTFSGTVSMADRAISSDRRLDSSAVAVVRPARTRRSVLLKLGRHGQALLFGALALGLGLAIAILRGPLLKPYGWIPLTAAVFAVLLCGGLRDRTAWSGFAIRSIGLRAWLPAIAIPGVVLTAGYVVAAVTGNARLGLGGTNPAVFGAITVAIVVAGSLEAIGEELGWRGYMLSRLADLGRVRAGLVTGLVWVAWHVPLIYIAAAYHGGAGPLYLLPFGVTIVAMSFVANELRMASGSAWPAVIFHGAHNGIWFQLEALTVGSTGLLAGIGDESGVVPMTLYVLIAVWIVRRRPAWRSAASSPLA